MFGRRKRKPVPMARIAEIEDARERNRAMWAWRSSLSPETLARVDELKAELAAATWPEPNPDDRRVGPPYRGKP